MGAWLLLCLPVAAYAQHADSNPVLSATDGFGSTLGRESIGLYGPGGVRGFSPTAAGNVRIEGLYFDEQGGLSGRVVEGSTIRVGISEIGYAFPAPTGIVDYELRHTGAVHAGASLIASSGPFAARGLSIDGTVPLNGGALQLPVGAAWQVSSQSPVGAFPGYTATVASVGATPEWHASERLTIRGLFDWSRTTHARTMPVILTAGDYLPPDIPRTDLSQHWAESSYQAENAGALLHARLAQRWTLSAGVFRSTSATPQTYTDVYLNARPDGLADHWLIANRDQQVASTSGEVRLSTQFASGAWRHEFVLLARGRDSWSHYGGAAVVEVAGGPASIGLGAQVPEPHFSYAAQTQDHTALWSAGVAYRAQWHGRVDAALGLQRESYQKRVTPPGGPEAQLRDAPLRGYASLAALWSRQLTIYGGYAQGLEDSEVAPGTAANRRAILPAARTWQADTGVRVLLGTNLKLIAGVFQINKPYFNLDSNNVDRELGIQRARGVEFSLSGEPLQRLHVTAGALLGRVTILGSNLSADGVSTNAFGEPHAQGVINADYSFGRWPALSTDLAIVYAGATPATVNDAVEAPAVTTLALGARYRFSLHGAHATLRLQAQNLGNAYVWVTGYSPGYFPFAPRSVVGYLTMDL
jgi:iron complex outermembrane receptor protein